MTPQGEITLDELPAWSPWPARLLGLQAGRAQVRTPEVVLREYDVDKYAPLACAFRGDSSLSCEDLKGLELGEPERLTAMSVGDRLYVTTVANAIRRSADELIARIGPYAPQVASLVDLGCGYGYQLDRIAEAGLGLQLRGGELSATAVALGRNLGMDLKEFDFSSEQNSVFVGVPSPCMVVLSFVLSQLPSSAVAVDSLAANKRVIGPIVSFDYDQSVQGAGLLGLMRRRYAEFNDYSGDLLDVLQSRDDVEIASVEPNVIGPNALFPATCVVWNFR